MLFKGVYSSSAKSLLTVRVLIFLLLSSTVSVSVSAWLNNQALPLRSRSECRSECRSGCRSGALFTKANAASPPQSTTGTSDSGEPDPQLFDDFVNFLQNKQREIIEMLEELDGSGTKFTNDTWGCFAEDAATMTSGGMTRVIQGGDFIEKGACSFTLIQQGVLSSERAKAIRSRQHNGDVQINAGDTYSAAALSMVLHTRSPLVPTFRSDVRIFSVHVSNGASTMAWFGGGADLTPYYLDEKDISAFHQIYADLAESHPDLGEDFTYENMKKTCDDYFYLPARSEHRGTGGIFFDDLEATPSALDFCQGVATAWMPSWLPIVKKHRATRYTDQQRQWQLLRRGRYLEFNLLYDRGVQFGLANANPRVEGVMVSAPPLIAWEYNHQVLEGSPEDAMMKVLKEPRDWL